MSCGKSSIVYSCGVAYRVQRRLGPERRDVLEVRRVVDIAGIPRVERGAHVGRADEPLLVEPLGDRHPDHVHFARHEIRGIDADGLRERREPDPRRKRPRLVVHVDDLGLPLAPGVLHDARFDHVEHVGVAVVVVADVLLVQARHARQLVRRADVLHVPVRDHLLAVRVDCGPEHQHDVVEHRPDLRLGRPADQVVGQQRRVLAARHLRCVQAAVDVHERPALPRERARLRLAHRTGVRQAQGDLAQPIEVRQVGGARNEREVHRPALARFSGVDELHERAGGRQLPEVGDRLVVVGQLVVGAGLETEGRRGRGNRGTLRLGAGGDEQQQQECERRWDAHDWAGSVYTWAAGGRTEPLRRQLSTGKDV